MEKTDGNKNGKDQLQATTKVNNSLCYKDHNQASNWWSWITMVTVKYIQKKE